MSKHKAARGSGNYSRAKGSGRTRSILANNETFCLVTWTVLFTFALLAVPTAMALLKCWEVW